MRKVSIVVPIYNAEKSLIQCLDSLVNQSLKDIEIILVDDASKDQSKTIMEQYKKKYADKIITIHNKKNQGIGKTRNIGIKSATGEFIGFVDSDDYVDLHMYEDYYNFAKENKLDVVTANYYKVKDNEEHSPFYSEYFKCASLKQDPSILLKIEYGPCNKIVKRNIIHSHNVFFDEEKKYEDMPFVAKCLYYAKKIGHMNSEYYYYRVHDNSETTTMDKRVFDMFEIMNQVNELLKKETYLLPELEMLNIQQITRYMLQQKKQKDKLLKKEFINQGYKYLNTHFPNWKENNYYKKTNYLKRVIKNNPWLLKIYCSF